jgi:hypothetical protein
MGVFGVGEQTSTHARAVLTGTSHQSIIAMMKRAAFVSGLLSSLVVLGVSACSHDPGARVGVANETSDASIDTSDASIDTSDASIDTSDASIDASEADAADAADAPDTSSPDGMMPEASVCFPCQGRWICGGGVTYELKPEEDGCYLSGLPDRNLISPDGTITAGGVVVGMADGSGARVRVSHPDGGLWLYCAAGGGCPR